MSIVVRFTGAPSLTAEKYDDVLRRLGDDFPPDGLDYHVAFSSDGTFRVSEIWDSPEQLQAFVELLRPLFVEVGAELAGDPEIFEVHNIVKR